MVFGATGGIGSELSRILVACGKRVVLVGRDAGKLDALSGELESPSHVVDVTSAEAVEQVASDVLETHGRLDGMANCVGSLLLQPADLTSPDDWAAILETNLGSAVRRRTRGRSGHEGRRFGRPGAVRRGAHHVERIRRAVLEGKTLPRAPG